MNPTFPLTASRPKTLFKTAAVMALLIAAAGLIDAVTSNMGASATENTTIGAAAWLALFHDHPFTAFSCLGMINILTLSFGIPVYLALFQAQRKQFPALAGLAALLFFMGAAVYFSTNTVLPLYGLSRQYTDAPAGTRAMLESAAQALLAEGADLTPGTFPAFFLTQTAALLMTGLLWKSRLFGRWTAGAGLAGSALTSVFFVLAAFAPGAFSTALLFGMPGGMLLTVYQVLLAVHFFRMAK